MPPPTHVPDRSPPDRSVEVDRSRLPNIVMLIFEATSYRATSLDPSGPPSTPFMKLMATRGFEAKSMRAVIPHTSKSVYSALCGRYPAMQHQILESADDYPMRCLAAILGDSGYRSAFFQSADGCFEDRPRLVANMGFDEFYAFQDVTPPPEPLGYLAGDDLPAVANALHWARAKTDPFFLVVLTSATHHPYQLPTRMTDRAAGVAKLPVTSRYLMMVSDIDRLLFGLVQGLAEAGRDENTIFVAFGDHGESFGDHGGWQHDNIYTEEGLRVPFVIQAPGRIAPGSVQEQERSLIDVAPTLLDLADIPYVADRFEGRSLLEPAAEPVRRYFACWYTDTCVGYVKDGVKAVLFPSARSWLTYDLVADPQERRAQIEPAAWRPEMRQVKQWYEERRYAEDALTWSPRDLFGAWHCEPRSGECRSIRR